MSVTTLLAFTKEYLDHERILDLPEENRGYECEKGRGGRLRNDPIGHVRKVGADKLDGVRERVRLDVVAVDARVKLEDESADEEGNGNAANIGAVEERPRDRPSMP